MHNSWLGLTAYHETLKIQADTVQQSHEAIFGLEHHPVITLGKRANTQNDVLVRPQGFELHKVERGGEATLHNPGQLVIYPVLNLKERKIGARNYVELLLRTTEKLLEELNISCFRKQQPGLYTQRGKIAFVGVRIKNGWSSHGLAINVNNQLKDFNSIVSCGVNNQSMDRIGEYRNTNCKSLFDLWLNIFVEEICQNNFSTVERGHFLENQSLSEPNQLLHHGQNSLQLQ